MSRRSSRLVSGGYYNSADEESDSSSVTNISYRENSVKVFKKKGGKRKAGSRTPAKAKGNASPASPASPEPVALYDGLGSSPAYGSETKTTSTRTVSYVSYVATPRPPLTPSTSRSQTPTRCCHSATPEKSSSSSLAGLCASSSSSSAKLLPGGSPHLLGPEHKQASRSGVDSSGYSSSEGTRRNPAAAATFTRGGSASGSRPISSNRRAPTAAYVSRISRAFCDSVSLMAAAVHLKIVHLRHLASSSHSGHMKKAFGVFLLLLVLLLSARFLYPLLIPLITRMAVAYTELRTEAQRPPVIPTTQPDYQPVITHHTPVLDPAVVSAAVEARMQSFMKEMKVKQEEGRQNQEQLQLEREQLLSQKQDRLQLDLQDIRARLEEAVLGGRLRLEQEVAALGQRMTDHQTDSRTAASGLGLQMQALEAEKNKLLQEWSSFQMIPPPAPCPDVSAGHSHDRLTPELQQAMEKWLTDRIKEQDAVRLWDKGCSSDCGRPMADKMADFALETQGASVISTRCSETYRIRSACVTLFGFPLWYPSESPRTVIQGFPVLLPGKCWAFHGVEGTLVISLSHPITITHVTLDHLPRYNSPTGRIESAPKDFEVYGMKDDGEKGTLLGTFTYDEDGESTQTFKLPVPNEGVFRFVELHVLSNWGHVEYTCLYRFRVHGQTVST